MHLLSRRGAEDAENAIAITRQLLTSRLGRAATHFDSAERLVGTIKRYVQVYNQHLPQKALGHIPPLQAMKNWYQKQPNLFKKRVYNLEGLDRQPLKAVGS